MSIIDRILLSTEAHRVLLDHIAKDEKLETGGILLGNHQDESTAIVRHVTGPGPAARRRASRVDFDASHLQAEQDSLMIKDPTLCFLGDWHYHPRGMAKPSRKDVRVLRQLSEDPDYQLGRRAIILILCRGDDGIAVRGYRSSGGRKAIEVASVEIMTGPFPSRPT